MKTLWQLCLFGNIVHLIAAVKIGISRPDLMTTSTTSTTTTTIQTPNSTTDLSDISSSSSVLTETTVSEMLNSSTVEENSTTTPIPSTTSTIATTTKTTTTKATVKPKPKPRAPTKTPATATTSTTESLSLKTDNNNNDLANATTSGENKEYDLSLATNLFFCACNLLPNECDINCCCDQDCSKDALLIFDCHQQPAHPELKPRLEDFQYQHGLPSCKINDGWLCVFRSNVKVEQMQLPSLIADTSDFYKWSSLMEEAVPLESVATSEQFYKYGATMQLINLDTMDIKNFELPHAFLGARCLIKEPIGYLKETRRQCQLETLNELEEQKHEMLNNFKSYKLLKRPLNQILDTEKMEEYLLDIKPMRCALKNDKTYDCKTANISELWQKNYYAFEIELVFRHNFTQLLDGEVKLKEREILGNTTEVNSTEYWQIYTVKFQYYNGKQKESKMEHSSEEELAISGALGYLQGQPLIMAHFIAFNSSLEMHDNNRVLSYFHPNSTKLRSKHSLLLMSQRHELCTKELSKQHFINFGINVLKQCKVRLQNTTDLTKNPTEQNFTAICEALQKQAMQQLFTVSQNKEQIWISQLGKPENNTEQKWIPLEWKNFEFASVIGVYNEPFQSFTCRNMLLNVQYEFQMGNFMENGVAHQNLVKQATLTSGRRHDLEFSLTETLELPLTVSVMFYDYVNSVGKKQLHSGAKAFTVHTWIFIYLCALITLAFRLT